MTPTLHELNRLHREIVKKHQELNRTARRRDCTPEQLVKIVGEIRDLRTAYQTTYARAERLLSGTYTLAVKRLQKQGTPHIRTRPHPKHTPPTTKDTPRA